jgi:hypothetical protein
MKTYISSSRGSPRIFRIIVVSFAGLWCLAATLYGSSVALGLAYAAIGSSARFIERVALGVPSILFLLCLWVLPLLQFRSKIPQLLKRWAVAIWLTQIALASIALVGAKKYGPGVSMRIMNRFPPQSAKP